MCGIAGGFWHTGMGEAACVSLLSDAIAVMHNRGPDASGIVQYRPNESAQSILGLGSA